MCVCEQKNTRVHTGVSACTNLYVPVICSGFVKLLSQFEGDLRVLESAQRFNDHLVSFLADDHCGFGDISYLPCCKANTLKIYSNNTESESMETKALISTN